MLVLTASSVFAASRFSVASGNWSSTSTWSATSGGASGASAPIAGDDATIEGGFTVTLSANAASANVTVKNASTVDASTFTLTVSSTFTLQAGSTFKQGGTVQTQPGVTRVFDSNSTYIFNGAQTSISAPGNFGNLTWSSTANSSPGTNLTITGNLTLLNSLQLRGSTGTTARTHTVSGNVVIDGASAVLVGTNAAATPTTGSGTSPEASPPRTAGS